MGVVAESVRTKPSALAWYVAESLLASFGCSALRNGAKARRHDMKALSTTSMRWTSQAGKQLIGGWRCRADWM